MEVIDLDVLRTKPKIIKLGGNEIDVSFIPCAITWDIDCVRQELIDYTIKLTGIDKQIKEDKSLSVEEKDKLKIEYDILVKKVFVSMCKVCSIFCEHNYPEMTEEWFGENVDANQVKAFYEVINDTLFKAYNGIETEAKNLKAPRKKKSH